MSTKRIEHIDVWRLIAVLLVIQEHFFLFSGVDKYWSQAEVYSLQIERFGELGVLLFFSISGFVICTALKTEKQAMGRICLSAFYVRRFFRIMPPLWLYLITLLLLKNAGIIEHINRVQALTSALFVCNFSYFIDNCPWYVGHTWSLAYEEQFYLVFPLVLLWGWKSSGSQRILWVMSSLIGGAIALRLFQQLFLSEYFSYFSFLLAGCYTALLSPHWMQRLRNLPLFLWLLAIVLLASCLAFLPDGQDKFIKALCYPLLIQLIIFGTPIQIPNVKKIFENHQLSYLGRISYSVYLWQELVTAYHPTTLWWQTIGYLGLVFCLAAFSFQYFELPCQRLGSRISDRLKTKHLSNL
jgi:peptidoglycan/LPS O-acetylase OafA/YrhL